jgi:transcriptional regulator with XRE-family HTH domain
MARKEFGDRIRAIRESLGLTQEMLGRKVGVTKVSVARYEAGRIPRAEVLARMAAVAGVTVGSLLQSNTTPPPHGPATRKRLRVARSSVPELLPFVEPDWQSSPWRDLSEENRARYRKRVRKALMELRQALEEYRNLLLAQSRRS